MKNKKRKKYIVISLLIFLFAINAVAFFHAWKFTHFSTTVIAKTAVNLSFGQKLKTLFFGIGNPRPENNTLPLQPYQTVLIQSNKKLEGWLIKKDSTRGTVILFHGYGGCKSLMLDKAEVFLALGYSVFLIDFMGAGGSQGTQTTLGYKEAEEVKSCFDYIAATGEKPIYLFGTSLGAAAILKAIKDYHINTAGIMIECPFGTMYQTTCARFRNLGLPSFPMASLLVFWGGVQNGFWAFGHQPQEYAKAVTCPALLMYGALDKNVSREETDAVFNNLKGPKTLRIFPLAGHENYLVKYRPEWTAAVGRFLRGNN